MDLESFLSVLEPGIKLSVTETSGTGDEELIRMFSGGQEQLSTDILARTIDSIVILGKSYLQIHLTAV